MLKKVIFISILFLIILALSILGMIFLDVFLFQTSPWILAIPTFLGLLTGGLTARSKKTYGMTVLPGLVKRHTLGSFLEHWGTASGILVLIISGFLLFTSPSLFQMNLHFTGLFFTLLFGSYFLADFFVSKKSNDLLPNLTDIIDGTIKKYLFIKKWSDNGKYLSSQKSSFLALTALGIGITITGVIKITGIIWSLPAEVIQISTSIHDIAAVLFVIMVFIHILLVVIVRSNRRLLRSWFTGTIPEEIKKRETADAEAPDPNSL